MRAKITGIIRSLLILKRLILKELKAKNGISTLNRIYCYSRGFFSDAYVLYEFNKNETHLYLSDIQENIYSRHINRQNLIFIDNKIIFSLLMGVYVPIEKDILLIMDGKPIKLSNDFEFDNWNLFLDHIEKERKGYILKEINGASGYGIYKLSFNGENYQLNQKKCEKDEVLRLLTRLNNYIVSPIIIQAKYSDTIYSKSVNTIRILTMIDPDSQVPFIAAAAHRIGNELSYPVDNCAKGGFTAAIDIETGILGKATSTIICQKQKTWYSNHPDSGSPIEGIAIPQWKYIKESILKIAANISFLPYIGWDIVALNEGFTIIEGNDGPDIKLHQVHSPLLQNDKVRKFYKFHNVI